MFRSQSDTKIPHLERTHRFSIANPRNGVENKSFQKILWLVGVALGLKKTRIFRFQANTNNPDLELIDTYSLQTQEFFALLPLF